MPNKDKGTNERKIERVEKIVNSIKQNSREWANYKDVINGLHDYNPKAIFLTQTQAVLIGYGLKESWKKIWPNETPPKIFTVNPGLVKYSPGKKYNMAGLEKEANRVASIIKKYGLKGNLAVIDDIKSKGGGRTLEIASNIVDYAIEKTGIKAPKGKISSEVDIKTFGPGSYHVYSGGILDTLNYKFQLMGPWERKYESAEIKRTDKKFYGSIKREIDYSKKLGMNLGEAIKKEENRRKTIEDTLKGIMVFSCIGLLYSLFSKPAVINAQNVQLAPPFPNYMVYVFLTMLIGGAGYFLVKKILYKN